MLKFVWKTSHEVGDSSPEGKKLYNDHHDILSLHAFGKHVMGSSPVFFFKRKDNIGRESMLRKQKYKNIDFTEFVV